MTELASQKTTAANRWVVVSLWTFDDNITSWDYEAIECTRATLEEARLARDYLAKTKLYEVDAEEDGSCSWCIGIGIAPEPKEGHAPDQHDPDEETLWAEYVPRDFPEQEALE